MPAMDCKAVFLPSGQVQLGPKVVVGVVDIAAIGPRVLLSLLPPAGGTVTTEHVPLTGMGQGAQQGAETGAQHPAPAGACSSGGGDVAQGPGGQGAAAEPEPEPELLQPVFAAGDEGAAGSGGAAAAGLLVRHVFGPGAHGTPLASLLVLNAAVPEGQQGEVAAALLELLERQQGEGGQAAREVLVAAGMLLPGAEQSAGVYRHEVNGEAGAGSPALPALPPATRVRDGQLGGLLHVLRASGTRATCLLAPAHKPPASTPLSLPDSAPACDALGAAVAAALGGGVAYSPERCGGLVALRKWFVAEGATGRDLLYT